MAPRKNNPPPAPPRPVVPPPNLMVTGQDNVTAEESELVPQQPAPAAVIPRVVVEGEVAEAHPVGTAQYIADLERENADMLAKLQAAVGRATEGAKGIATAAMVHVVQMAGHYPQDMELIPSIDEINAAAQPR